MAVRCLVLLKVALQRRLCSALLQPMRYAAPARLSTEMGPIGPEPGSSGAVDLPEPELSNLGDIAKVG